MSKVVYYTAEYNGSVNANRAPWMLLLKIITKLYTNNNICCCYNFQTCSASSAKQSLTFLMLYSVSLANVSK